MTESELRTLVEETVRAILGQPPPPVPGSSAPSILVILTGAEHGHGDAIELIKALRVTGRLKVFPAACYTERFGDDELRRVVADPSRVYTGAGLQVREKLVDEAECVVFLQPLRATTAKIACGIPDSPPAAMVTRALMRGIACYTAGGDLDVTTWPALMPKPMRQGRNSFAELLEADLQRLQGWGLILRAKPADLAPLIVARPAPANPGTSSMPRPPSGTARQFLTSEDIRARHAKGETEISIPPLCIITDEAREVARSLFVKLTDQSE